MATLHWTAGASSKPLHMSIPPRGQGAASQDNAPKRHLGAGKNGQETAGALFDECSFPVLVKDFELRGWDATGDTARASIHGVGRADRSNPGCPVDPTGPVGHGRDPLQLLGTDLVAHPLSLARKAAFSQTPDLSSPA